MDQQENAEQICHTVVDRALARWGWMLITDPNAFARAVCQELTPRWSAPMESAQRDALARAATLATMRRLGPLIYDACAQAGTARQRDAFAGLGTYLYKLARAKTPDDATAQDCAQQALVNIWRRLEQCRDQQAFLFWCKQILLNVIRDHYRATRQTRKADMPGGSVEIDESKLDRPEALDKAHLEQEGMREQIIDPFEQAKHSQMREQLIAALHACLENAKHVAVVVRVLLDNHSYAQVAVELGTTPLNVQVMKSRAMAKLRTCAEVLHVYEQWLGL